MPRILTSPAQIQQVIMKLVINAADVPASSQDAVGRVTEGFQELISRTYTQLKLLGGAIRYTADAGGAAIPAAAGLTLVIGDTGVHAPTSAVNERVRRWLAARRPLLLSRPRLRRLSHPRLHWRLAARRASTSCFRPCTP